ncbi:pentapeptide repeat-containing protein, partial [bacterium]|nr:pentapeptide repeat-containing protein [bacterium]
MDQKGQIFVKQKLSGTDFSRAELKWAKFGKSDLRGCNFDGANCRRADFRGADLTGASFRDARLQKANFQGTVLRDVKFDGARLDGAEFDEDVSAWLLMHGYISNHREQNDPNHQGINFVLRLPGKEDGKNDPESATVSLDLQNVTLQTAV